MKANSKSYLAAALIILATIICIGLALLARQINRLEDEPPPTLAISETPSLTPIPPTASPTATDTATVTASPPSGVTAVSPPPDSTAVTPTPTATPTPSPTMTAAPPTATDERMLIKPGTTYWQESKNKYGRFEAWQCLKVVNGWPERSLPVGEYMRLPENCE